MTVRAHEWLISFSQFSHRNLFCHAVEEALEHPYLERLHDIADEPICTEPFSFDFEQQALTEDQMKQLIFNEAIEMNPNFRY
jgi:mitogen-activated protein kinase 1/3